MQISGAMSSAISSLTANAAVLAAVAENVANVNSEDFDAVEIRATSLAGGRKNGASHASGGVRINVLRQGDVDLGKEFSRLIQARAAYAFGARLLPVGDHMLRELLDLKA